jgi:AAA domain
MEAAEVDCLDLETQCHLCSGPLVEGNCIAYHWNDSIHLENREKMKAGLSPLPIEPHVIPARDDWGPCWVCGAKTDPEGRCTRVNEFFHEGAYSSWMNLFHSRHEAENAPPVTFLINGFLQREGVTAIAAPVRERKSLIALNVCHALLTGEKLFDYFDVVKKPGRVIYLCPEVSLGPFTDRLRKIRLLDYVGKRLFYRTLSADGHLKLDDNEFRACVSGSVVFLDTAIRFLDGDENSSKDVRKFADGIFQLLKWGAESVVLIHHSPKGAGDMMTLENAMRGSGDMGAFLACCWGTRLQDPQHPYKSASYLENLKMRDFESQPFQVTCDENCRMHIVGDPTSETVTLQTRRGNPGNKDGKDDAAEAFIRAHPSMSIRDIEEQLAASGIKRRKTWIGKARARIRFEAA